MKNTKDYNSFNNPIPIPEWCEGLLAESVLSPETENLAQELILVNSLYESAFTSTPVGCKLVGGIRLEFTVSDESFTEIKRITGEILNYHEPSMYSPYHWLMIKGNGVSDYITIIIHTEPLEVVFTHNLKS